MRIASAASLAVVLACFPASAFAQDASEVSAARELGKKGVMAADAGRCEEAVDLLSRAGAVMAVPSILVPLAECQLKLGKVVAGTESLEAAVRQELGKDSPEAYKKAQARARILLPAARKRLGRMIIVVDAPAGTKVTVVDNAAPVTAALVGVERPVDPGKHVIEAKADGFVTMKREVNVDPGGQAEVRLALEPDPSAPEDPPSADGPREGGGDRGPAAPSPAASKGPSTLLIVGASSLALGGVGLIVGAATGGVAFSKQADLDDVCSNDKRCPPSSAETLDSMETYGNLSTGFFVASGVLAALGATLLVVDGVVLAPDEQRSAGVTLRVGPMGAALGGSF